MENEEKEKNKRNLSGDEKEGEEGRLGIIRRHDIG